MRWGGVLLLVFLVSTSSTSPSARSTRRSFIEGDTYRNVVGRLPRSARGGGVLPRRDDRLGLHLYHGIWSSGRTLGLAPPSPRPLRRSVALVLARAHLARLLGHPDRGAPGMSGAMTVELQARSVPAGPDRAEVGQAPLRDEAGEPGQQAEVHRHRGRAPAWPAASAAATLGELGYNVKCFCFQDSPRRAHSIAAQGGINAAKNYQNDGDSIYRLFYDTVKGGDFRSREANVYRLAQISVNIIDQCVAQGVPFAREYGGLLANRSFGGAQVSRTFYARGQTGQQLLLGAYQALEQEIAAGRRDDVPAHRDARPDRRSTGGRAASSTATWSPGEIESHAGRRGRARRPAATATCSTSRPTPRARNVTAIWRAYKRGAAFANPCFTQIHPTCIPVSGEYQSKLTLMSESLRNDGRVWVPKQKGDKRPPDQIPEDERDYYLERKYPSFGNLAPRDIASRAAKEVCDEGRGVGAERAAASTSISPTPSSGSGEQTHPRALRQPVRDVRADHRRESVQGADAHLPGRALHDGRALGGLQPDEHHSRACT